MLNRKVLAVALLCLVLSLTSLVFAQANGSLSGTVADKTGGVLTGATVKVTSQTTGLERETKTDDSGHYLLPLLPVAVFTIHVEAKGFQITEQRDIRLQVNEQREIDFTLNPASVTQSVEVSADQVAVETSNPSLGQVITEQEVAELPLNGRDFVQLASLTPGATQETNPNSFFTSGASSEVAARGSFSLSVGGSRPNSTDWMLDNVDNNELTAGGIGIFSSVDDVQEFKVLTYNYSAEYGTRAGPTVLVTSKSGTNAWHGTLYEFLRNKALDAKSYFATSAEKFNLNQFGGSIGGPIQKNKTFFFIDGEQKYQRRGITFTGLLPTTDMRNGDFSADPFGVPHGSLVIANPNMYGAADPFFQCDGSGNPLPANPDGSQAAGVDCNKIPTGVNGLANPIGQALINLYPTPNANAGCVGCSFNFVNEPVRSLDETKMDVRLDHNFSTVDSAFARFSYDQANSYVPGGAGTGFLTEQNAFGSNQRIINHGRQIALGETHQFSSNTVNQATFGYNRIFNYILSQGTGSCASANLAGVGIPGANLGCTGSPGSATCGPGQFSCGLVSVLMFGGYWSIGDRGYSPFQGGTNVFSFGDTLDLIRGKHDIKVGLGVRANQMNVGTEAFQDGFWIPGVAGNFSGAGVVGGDPEADTLLGILGLSEHDQTFNGPVGGRRWKIIRPFVQDDWRITSNLTLNLGLAWDMTTPIKEQHGRLADYDPVSNKLLVANKDGVNASAGINMYWGGLEPRIGFAYKLLGSDKTVIRGGYGMFHDSAWSQGAQGLWQNPPFFAESDYFGPAGCAFATSYCATTLDQTPLGLSMSTGFPIFSGPPDLSTFTGTLFYQPTNFKPGTVQQFNVNVERQLPGNVVLTAGYAGARGHHILVFGNNINTYGPDAGICAENPIGCNPDGSQYVPPYLAANGVFNSVLEFADLGDTKYDSLQIKAETKTSRHGLYALFSYTYAHAYDNGLTDGLGSLLSAPYFPLPNWQNRDWAPSQLGVHNNFTASMIYDLPFGKGREFGGNWNDLTNTILGNWQVTLIEHITSGYPTPLIDSNNQSGVFFNAGGNGNNYNRPNQVSGCNPQSGDHSHLQWVNTSCFSHVDGVTTFGLGNASRVPVVGPDFVNTDFSIIKQFALPREGMGLNFRAEFFNLFNHTQFGLPVNDISGIGFGSVQSTVNNPRLVQFALKLTF
ncbi:MAG TPA: carboxypeptidase-like regulatory domain-containing protein [Terriglobales bacterium]|nr:carboxypeptidase-like regulatory domain-containing protein [Terriglobales bacterium]